MEQFQHLQDLNIYTSCRTCLENLNDVEIHYDIFAITDLQEKLTVCLSLPVEQGDGLPTSLCESCHTKIDDFYIFQQMSISARARFQDYINSERKPCSMELAAYSNNPTDFMIFTVTNKENEDEDYKSPNLYSKHTEAEPSFGVQIQIETSYEETEELEKSQSQYVEYNINVKDSKNLNVKNNSSFPLNKLNFECEICKKCFKKSETFEVHMSLHQGIKPFPCQMCEKSYSRRGRLKLHIKDKHERRPDENLPCNELSCYKIQSSKQTLYQHTRDIHYNNGKKHKQPDIGEECGKVQIGLDVLKNRRHLHTGKPLLHECPHCNKSFITKNILKEHIGLYHNVKKYIRPHCGAMKTTRRDLKKNINSHTKEKKYPCQYCDMVYYNINNVNRHKRIVHEGIKDFPCSYCDKSFGRVETRKHHEMTHTGEKPHECNICHKKFIQIFSLKTHQKVHTNG